MIYFRDERNKAGKTVKGTLDSFSASFAIFGDTYAARYDFNRKPGSLSVAQTMIEKLFQ